METLNGTLQLENFYPKGYLQVTGMDQEACKIIIRMKSNVSKNTWGQSPESGQVKGGRHH